MLTYLETSFFGVFCFFYNWAEILDLANLESRRKRQEWSCSQVREKDHGGLAWY